MDLPRVGRRWMVLLAPLWLHATWLGLLPKAWAQGAPGDDRSSPKTTRVYSHPKVAAPPSSTGLRLSRELGFLADEVNDAASERHAVDRGPPRRSRRSRSAAPVPSGGPLKAAPEVTGDRRIPLPSGELNRGGVVPAGRMRFRDGELVLEPSDADSQGLMVK